MAEYSFTTTWRFQAPVERVWSAVTDVERWPQWWRGVEAVTRVSPGGPLGVGAVYRYTWKSRLPYRLTFVMETTAVELFRSVEGRAQGELEGTGRWSFDQQGSVTTTRYDWNVRTAEAWMNWLAPLARPVFGWNHDVIMEWGRQGLTRLLAQ